MMNSKRKFFVWLYLLQKRLFKKLSFVVILLLIPVVVISIRLVSKQDSGVLKIILCAENPKDSIASEIIDNLLNEDGVILFEYYDDIDKALKDVNNGTVNAVWSFPDDMQSRIKKFASNNDRENLVNVIEHGNSISLQLSHEKLYGVLNPYISYEIYYDFVRTAVVKASDCSDEEVAKVYNSMKKDEPLIRYESMEGRIIEDDSNYITAPLRGILSLIVILCGIAAVIYHLNDNENGIYCWLTHDKRLLPMLGNCISGIFDCSVIMLAALMFSGISGNWLRELISIAAFILSSCGFCMLLGVAFGKSGRLGAVIPLIMTAMFAVSPIFFNMSSMRIFQYLLPTFYYLYSINNFVYIIYELIYSAVIFIIVYIIHHAREFN